MIAVLMGTPLAAASRIADAIAARGYAIEPGFASPAHVAALRTHALALDARGALRPAAVGRGAARVVAPATRGDRILWLEAAASTPAEQALRAALEALRRTLNRSLALGLFTVEAHYAVYPPGARYARHRDRFRDDDARVLSLVLYLNDAWRAQDGGALRLHLPASATLDVRPEGGTLAAFLADAFEHEVLPATRPRLSLTGWFRRRE